MKMRIFLFTLLFVTKIFAAAPSTKIAFIEDTDSLPSAPFSERIEIFPSVPAKTDPSEKNPEHGVMVASVLVGPNSILPDQFRVAAIPNFESFPAFQETHAPNDLVLLNCSQTQGYPGMPPELDAELTSIVEGFKRCVADNVKRQELIASCQNHLEVFTEEYPLHPIIAMVKRYLECAEAMKSETGSTEFLTQELIQDWTRKVEASVDVARTERAKKARQAFDSMKESLVVGIAAHPNTLIIMALDNEPGCIDSFYTELFEGNNLLDHTILVSSTMGHIIQSAHTEVYKDHARVKPLRVGGVYNPETGDYEHMEGTSFGTPLVVMDAYVEASSGNMSFNTLKAALLSKVKHYSTYKIIEIEDGSDGEDSECMF